MNDKLMSSLNPVEPPPGALLYIPQTDVVHSENAPWNRELVGEESEHVQWTPPLLQTHTLVLAAII